MKIQVNRFGKPFDSNKGQEVKQGNLVILAIFLLITIVIVIAMAFCIESILMGHVINGQEATWTASIASYWGGIIGGMVSGVLAFLGVFYTIRYYKELDAKKERAAVQPFLMIEISGDAKDHSTVGFALCEDTVDKEKNRFIYVKIKNIGHGFANTLVVHTNQTDIGGHAFNRVINVGECAYTYFVISKGRESDCPIFALQYVDSKTNEYIQQYEIRKEYNRIIIENGYPQFIE